MPRPHKTSDRCVPGYTLGAARLIANKLKEVAEQMQKDKEFQAALHQFKKEHLQQVECENVINKMTQCQIVIQIHKVSFVDFLWIFGRSKHFAFRGATG